MGAVGTWDEGDGNFTRMWYRIVKKKTHHESTAMEATIYIVECADGSYYTGLTKQEIEARIWEHNEGIYRGYTFTRRPVKLVFTETYDRIIDAIERERQIKGWSRAKKEALMRLDYEALPELARNRQE